MGTCNSKNKHDDELAKYMRQSNVKFTYVNYGSAAVKQYAMWVNECGFPGKGSFRETIGNTKRKVRLKGKGM